MPKEKELALDAPETKIDHEKLAKYIRKVVREEVERYFDEQMSNLNFREGIND